MTISTAAPPRRCSGRLFLALGLGLAALGMVGYVVQVSMHRLFLPWYLPASATLGVVFLVISLWRTRTIWRWLALVLVVLLAGFEWTIMWAGRLPAYTGPVAAEQPFPTFATARADGTPFTQHDLEGDRNNVLVFFRGRW